MIQFHNNLLLSLLLFSSVLLRLIESSNSVCSPTCGATTVPYPFGFSAGCGIRLNCTNGSIKIGQFSVQNITSDRILVRVSPSCDRPIRSAADFFGQNYALTRKNVLLLRNCSSSPTEECSISNELISYQLNTSCNFKEDRVSCYANRTAGAGGGDFLSAAELTASNCRFLFSTVTDEIDRAQNMTSLVFSVAELEWWLQGRCHCAANADCVPVNPPVDGTSRFRCKCREGFEGDGFGGGGRGCTKG